MTWIEYTFWFISSLLILKFYQELDGFEQVIEFLEENAPALAASGAAIAILSTISSSTLPNFPPQGFPQPGSLLQGGGNGGGFTPSAVAGVGKF